MWIEQEDCPFPYFVQKDFSRRQMRDEAVVLFKAVNKPLPIFVSRAGWVLASASGEGTDRHSSQLSLALLPRSIRSLQMA